MTAEQIEIGFMVVGCGFASLVGYGVIPLGDDSPKVQRAKSLMRKVGPAGVLIALVLLGASFAR